MCQTPGDSNDPIKQLCGDDRRVLALLLEQPRERLRRMVALCLDPRIGAQLDASDVLQDAFLDGAQEHNDLP
jgi:RNA polymerase sigma-70 factor, ECF subfamily